MHTKTENVFSAFIDHKEYCKRQLEQGQTADGIWQTGRQTKINSFVTMFESVNNDQNDVFSSLI